MNFHAIHRVPALAGLLLALLGLSNGCTQSRTFTIYAKPAEARIIVDGLSRGPGPITQKFEFTGPNDLHHVRADLPGYEAHGQDIWPDTPGNSVVLELRPLGKRVVLTVGPVPAVVRVNGVPVTREPVEKVEYTLDPNLPKAEYAITADAPGYEQARLTLKGADRAGYYPLIMRPAGSTAVAGTDSSDTMRPVDEPAPPGMSDAQARADARDRAGQLPPQPQMAPQPPPEARPQPAPQVPQFTRDIVIETDPPKVGATIYIDGEVWGRNGVEAPGHEFKRDKNGKPLPEKVTATAPGFEGGEAMVRWEDQKGQYVIPLGLRKKDIRIVTDPAGAVVTIDDKPVPRDRGGAASATVLFPPTDPPGEPTTYAAHIAATGDAWEPQDLKIGWDEGRQEYRVKLQPARSAKALLLAPTLSWSPNGGWRAEAKREDTVAVRDIGEGPGKPAATRFAGVPADSVPDAIAVSPDGSRLICTVLAAAPDGSLKSSLRLFNTDGTPGGTLPGDGQWLDLTPAFTPDGSRILFSSDRGGAGRLNVWTMPLAAERGGAGAAGVKKVADSANATLWPSEDSNPQPRLFYETVLKGAAGQEAEGSEVRVYDAAAAGRTSMTLSRGTHPRPSPRNDSVVFEMADPNTGNRDLYLVADKDGVPLGGPPVNLTNTPDVDECDPSWSRNGARIAYASNAGADETGRRNYDVYVMTMTGKDRKQTRVTYNGSRDDGPSYDPTGRSIYFRSNRGGQWGVWKIPAP
jgi:Tol biopolymer transport system component